MITVGRRLIEVEADVGFEIWSRDLNSLFEEAAAAMYEIMVDITKVEPREKKRVEVEAEELDILMHEWLSELLFITDVESLVFSKFHVQIEGSKLKGEASGEPVNPEKHNVKTEIKAVTYYKLKVARENGLWRAIVVLDI
ncbi:MAG TPA: archease [Candidatus Korarchaeota archaeon]|nr:archease [Candidatus Korarchaeota archaeon]